MPHGKGILSMNIKKVDSKVRERCWFQSPIGWLTLEATAKGVAAIHFGRQGSKPESKVVSAHLRSLMDQLGTYFQGNLRHFKVKLDREGTDFQEQVWAALRSIPYGETRSYKDIAVEVGRDKAVRAVGSANNRNPLPIVVPCHRVVGSSGDLVGYAAGLKIKRFLLDLENSASKRKKTAARTS